MPTVHRPARSARGLQYCRGYTTRDDFTREPPGSPIPFTASTPGLKRDKLNLRANGWRTGNYVAAGGPVLWSHNHQQPAIGVGDPSVEPTRLRIAVRFDQEDPDALKIESKVRRGFLRSSSVGWDFTDGDGQLLEHWRMTPDNLARSAYYDLTELSIVNVPADPSAVAERQRRGLARYGRELVRLFDDVDRTDSDATEPEIRAAVIVECRRLGIRLADDHPQWTRDDSQPYGDVAYADPGYQPDGKARYPIDTEEHVRAAWSYINQAANAAAYTGEQLARIKNRIKAAGNEFGIDFAGRSHGGLIRAEELPGLLRGLGLQIGESTRDVPAQAGKNEPSAAAAVEPTAARSLLAAFEPWPNVGGSAGY